MSIDKATAAKEFEGWLEFKKIRPSKREDHAEFEDTIIGCICDGILTIDDDKKIHHKLIFPLNDADGNEFLTDLVFVPRINLGVLNSSLRNVKPGDGDGRITAHIAGLTGQNSKVIQKLDTEDRGVAAAIAMYFLV